MSLNIEDKKAVAPAEEVINTKLSEQLASVLADLTPREEQVLRKAGIQAE